MKRILKTIIIRSLAFMATMTGDIAYLVSVPFFGLADACVWIMRMVDKEELEKFQSSGDKTGMQVGDIWVHEGYNDGKVWLERSDGEGGEFNAEAFTKHIEEFYNEHF